MWTFRITKCAGFLLHFVNYWVVSASEWSVNQSPPACALAPVWAECNPPFFFYSCGLGPKGVCWFVVHPD